jgi:hypothetical protein
VEAVKKLFLCGVFFAMMDISKPLQQVEHTLHDLRSPKRGHTFWGLMSTLTLCALLLLYFHGNWLFQANEVMLGSGPDGFKNYMTSAWHVRHDSGYVQYSGMNYPFGEHVLFTDNQPIFSAAMQLWSHYISDISDNTVGWINLFQVISLMIGCGAIFLLFRKLHLPVAYAGAAAIVLTFLAPQYGRFDGHFGLSHTFVIPLMLYFLCRYEERNSRRYQSLHIGFLIFLAAQLHFYYFGLAALFLTLYIGFQILRNFTRLNIIRRMSHWFVMVIIPFTLLNIWVQWAHYSPDRPANPYGFTGYIGFWEGVFLPYEFMPLHAWIEKTFMPIREFDGEAKAYAGAMAIFFTLWLLLSGFKMFGRSWDEAAYHRTHKHYLRGIYFSALLLLIFSCGFPFAIKGMEWIVDYFGPLKQFRGLGRFTWIYYYALNILLFYSIWNWSRRFKGFGAKMAFPQFKWAAVALPVLVLGAEAWIFQQNRRPNLVPNITQLKLAADYPEHWLKTVDFSPYQAILPLPYYHVGSENIWMEYNYELHQQVQKTAYHTGLPDMGVNLSRTPLSETLKSLQLVLEPCDIPEILAELPDNRPILILTTASLYASAIQNYPHLLHQAKMIFENGQIKLLRLDLDEIRSYKRNQTAAIEREMVNNSAFQASNTVWRTNTPNIRVVHEDYDLIGSAPEQFQGKGALCATMRDTLRLWKGPLPAGRYTMSCWVRAIRDLNLTHLLYIDENNHRQEEGIRFYVKTIIDGWALIELDFTNHNGGVTDLYFYRKGANNLFIADELLIRPSNTNLYRRESGWVVRNNYWYRADTHFDGDF